MTWNWAAIIAASLVGAGALYVRLRWRRAPQAYTAMVALAVCYFATGAVLGAWSPRLLALRPGATEPSDVGAIALVAPAVPAPPLSDNAANPLHRFNATVTSILDGDTVDVAGPSGVARIRLAGIDAPEHDQSYGPESTQHLTSLLSTKTVSLDCEDKTSYGRLICKILLPSGEDICLDQVKAGMAWHYKQYQDEQSPEDRLAYAAAECAAMKAKLGLWSNAHPMQPQDFRHGTNSAVLLDGNGCRKSSEPTTGAVVGNSRSHIFEWPGCPYYSEISLNHRVPFTTPEAAEAAGYRPAHNCP